MFKNSPQAPAPSEASASREEAKFLTDQFAKQATKTVLLDDVGMLVLDELAAKTPRKSGSVGETPRWQLEKPLSRTSIEPRDYSDKSDRAFSSSCRESICVPSTAACRCGGSSFGCHALRDAATTFRIWS